MTARLGIGPISKIVRVCLQRVVVVLWRTDDVEEFRESNEDPTG